MRLSVSQYVRNNAVAFLALFVALGGTGAYAANTIGSDDVIDDSLQSVDIKNFTVALSDLAGDSVKGNRVIDDSLGGADVLESSLGKVPNAATLSGRTASGISRAAHASDGKLDLGRDGRSVLATTDLFVPHDGFVLLHGGAVAEYGGCERCYTHLRFRDATNGIETNATFSLSNAPNVSTYLPLTHSAFLRVARGNHTFELIGEWRDASTDEASAISPTFWEKTLTALYVPYDGAGRSLPVPE